MKPTFYLVLGAVLTLSTAANAERRIAIPHAKIRPGQLARDCGNGPLQSDCGPVIAPRESRYKVGYRFPAGFNSWTPYYRIPGHIRARHRMDPGGRYVYDGYYVYRVDPVSLTVTDVMIAVLR